MGKEKIGYMMDSIINLRPFKCIEVAQVHTLVRLY